MIVVDASALVAMLLDEPERAAFFDVVSKARACLSPVGYWEAAIKLGRQRGPAGVAELDQLLADFDIRIVDADHDVASRAIKAEREFGKRTAAGLNMGDCFAYALAKQLDAPLLYKGADFNRTDIQAALTA
ncbi:type II toxin-antitoxin system VapC family toxin [Brevundimonas sp.]|uniref:type II toxin-antitoxin system VapC family toxin n=1 Tax=Brevundimonas sp. TaxID=1871086 RepID=UPI002EDB1E42